ncbi:MAG: GDP-mannose 4,6-dehydratase [Candidatus Liptonbacteria bacterium]|nr:GDP-mannose 4,6-dehydratase [Candidatus Liptonbacteria bacterium]
MEKRIFKKALITGITGSGGSYLADYIVLHCPGVQVSGVSRWHSTSVNSNVAHLKDKIKIYECDLNDFSSILRVLKEVKPDVIFHLAAYANVRAAWLTPLSMMQNNIMSTANLFEAVRSAEIDPVIQICSTSEVYGQVDPKNVPIKEDCPIIPSNPYAVSKVAGDFLGFTYFRAYGMKVVRTRMFAYLNPRREDLFATSWAKQVALIEAGKQKELLHGNLDSVRTLIDVRDAMESYWVAAEKCEFGEAYNIGGPTVIKIGDFLDVLKNKATVQIPSRIDPALLRPADVTLQIPDITKFINATGWRPRYSFEESVLYLLEFWRNKIKEA